MIRSANIVDEVAGAEIRDALLGQRCWNAFVSFGCTIGLDLGRKVPRDPRVVAGLDRFWTRMAKKRSRRIPRKRASRFEGESHVIIWCSWRIDDGKGPLASSDNETAVCVRAVVRLVGKPVQQVAIGPGWELRMTMASGLTLSVFPDHVGDSANFDGNWELWRPDQAYLIGTDLTCKVIDRENRPMRLQPRRERWQVAADSSVQK